MADQTTLRRLPLVPSTVTINGHRYAPRDIIWAGMRWHSAQFRKHSLAANDPNLSVPWCHPDDDMTDDECGWYRVRPLDQRGRFVKCRNGGWMIEVPK